MMIQSGNRFVSRTTVFILIGLAVSLGGLSMPAFAVFLFAGSWTIFDLNRSAPVTLCIDAALCGLFFLQHSGMVRGPFRRWIRRRIPEAYTATVYASASGFCLWVLILFWQGFPEPLLQFNGAFRGLLRILFGIAVIGTLWGNLSLTFFDPMGIKSALRNLRNQQPQKTPFSVRGPYRWVRHPLYFFSLLMIWACPDWTLDRFLFNLLWTVWILLGALLEERDLTSSFGDIYERYQQEVPMLIPFFMPKNRKKPTNP